MKEEKKNNPVADTAPVENGKKASKTKKTSKNPAEAKAKKANEKVQEKYIDKRPVWDLSTYFEMITDPAIVKAKENIMENVQDLIEDKDRLVKMREYDILSFIRKYEKIVDDTTNLVQFASLTLCTDRNNEDKKLFDKRTVEFAEYVFSKIGWIHNTLYNLPWEKKVLLLQSPKFKDYQEFLMCNLLLPPALNEATRKAITKMSSTTNDWHSLYRQLTAKLSFEMDGKTYTLDEIKEVAEGDKSKEVRDKAQKAISAEFKKYGYIFTQTLNSIYKSEDNITKIYLDDDDDTVSRVYEYDALDADGFGNGLSREQILAVATAVTDSYVPVSQRFYKLLAKLQEKEQLDYNDRGINPITAEDKKILWGECLELVLITIMAFNPAMAMSGITIVNANMIHALPMEGKDTGAFCVSGEKPFIFLNYRENMDSVITFAHEFGHGIHHLYARETAGLLNDNTPISMAEVASTFNEKLMLNQLLANPETTEQQKLYLLIEDVFRQISTIHRQIAFSKFELRAFRERQKGELSEERFTQIYTEEMERYLGIKLREEDKTGWMEIPHFFNSPFYVRYYAFAGMVTNRLWNCFLSQEFEDFPDRYLNMLSNTGLEDIEDLLDHFELNPNTPDFWTSAIDSLSNEIDMIEALAKNQGLLKA